MTADQQAAAQAKLAEKVHALAEYWASQAKLWDDKIKQWHDVVLFCREQRRRIHELRGGTHGKDITRES